MDSTATPEGKGWRVTAQVPTLGVPAKSSRDAKSFVVLLPSSDTRR
jgi:hypothetical protein